MQKYLILTVVFLLTGNTQTVAQSDSDFHANSFGVQAGLTLLENPFVLYPIVNLSYSRNILGKDRHQLAVFPQIAIVFLPEVETKFLFSSSLQYKYISKKRFEANIFLGINYQLRRLAYDRYEFEDNDLKNKGRLLHQFGPTTGLNIGYKIIKRNTYSISPNIGIGLTKLNKSYEPNLFEGYKPSLFFGVTLTK